MIPLGAFIGGRIMLKTGRHKPLQLIGTAGIPIGLLGLAFVSPTQATMTSVLMSLVGLSIGVVLPSSLVAVQNAVPRNQLGVATAGTAFFRSLGGAIGVAVLSAILLASMHGGSSRPALPQIGETAGAQAGEAPVATHATASEADAAFRRIFIIAAAISSLAFVFALRVPDNHLGGPKMR